MAEPTLPGIGPPTPNSFLEILEELLRSPFAYGVGLAIAFVALYFTINRFYLKRGIRVTGTFQVAQSVDCDDRYVSGITLENLKDRAVTIFSIFLKVGHDVYIEIEDFETTPLIIKPFEAYQKQYDPIERYQVNLKRVDLEDILSNNRISKVLVLSTSSGRRYVKPFPRQWIPTYEFFRNHRTAVVHTSRGFYKGRAYGSNIIYLVEIGVEPTSEVIGIRRDDHKIKRFRNFQLTEESLRSKERLEEFLASLQEAGVLQADQVKVVDLEDWRRKNRERWDEIPLKINADSWFSYRVLGPIETAIDRWSLWLENRRRKRKASTPPSV